MMGTLGRAFRAPWLATIRSTNGYLFLLLWFGVVALISKPLSSRGRLVWFGITLLALAVALTWKLAINALWLARDARALRLPGIEAGVNVLPLLFAIATVVLPSLVLGAVFGHALWWLLGLTLVASTMVALCLLPLIVAMPAFAAVVAMTTLFGIHPALPGDAGFVRWALPTAVALVLIATERWRGLMGATAITATGWWRPATLGGHQLQLRRLSDGAYAAPRTAGGRPGRKVTRAPMRDIGPGHPIRSIRVAVRGAVPLDTRVDPRHYWRWRLGIAIAIVLPAIGALIAQRIIGVAAMRDFAPQWLFIGAIVLTVSALVDRTTELAWCNPRADLSVLALLPGLGPPPQTHRDALIACVAGTFVGKLACTASGLLLFTVLHLPAMFYVYLLLMLATGTAMHAATTTGSLCGRAHRLLISYTTYGIVTLGVAVAAMNWGVRTIDGPSVQILTPTLPSLVCVAAWLACCAGCGAIAWANWRRFICKPHPFLPNTAA